jgi:hypothetical protein
LGAVDETIEPFNERTSRMFSDGLGFFLALNTHSFCPVADELAKWLKNDPLYDD